MQRCIDREIFEKTVSLINNFKECYTSHSQAIYKNHSPGNDIVSATNSMATGVLLILFTAGRGTTLGGAVPTLKIASNQMLAAKKPSWINFAASPVLSGKDLTDELFSLVLDTVSGKRTKNEESGYDEIAIFKNGVIL